MATLAWKSWLARSLVKGLVSIVFAMYFHPQGPNPAFFFKGADRSGLSAREFKRREVAEAPIYVIVHSLLELSFCTRPFPTPSGWLHRPINSVARLATPTACSGTSAGRHLSRDDSILAARRMQVNGK